MFKLPRKTLADELVLLAAAIETKSTIPALSQVLVQAQASSVRFTATDLDVTIMAEIEPDGEVERESYCLPFSRLRAAAKLFDGDTVRFTSKPNSRIEIACGRSRQVFAATEAEQFPAIEEVKATGVVVDGPRLHRAIERTLRCVDTKPSARWALKGIKLEAKGNVLTLVACDGSHMAVDRVGGATGEFEFLLPTKGAEALRGLLVGAEAVEITIGDSLAQFRVANRTLLSRRLVGDFIQWEQIVPRGYAHTVSLPGGFVDALRRCCVTAESQVLVRNPLRLHVHRDRIAVESYGNDEGQSFEELPAECATLNGEAVTININGDQLIGYLRTADSPTLSFKDERGQLLLTDSDSNDYQYVSMPLAPDR